MRHLTLALASILTACGGGPFEPDGSAHCARDAECDDGRVCNGVERCVEGACVYGEPMVCDDGVACTIDRCLEELGECVSERPDRDGDGSFDIACGGDDCDDADPLRYPGAVEVCDATGRDEDCDPTTFGERDADADGSFDARCCNGSVCGDDCDDMHPGAHPAEAEECDGVDNDCDGAVDESVLFMLYRDADRDMWGRDDETRAGCLVEPGWAERGGDCADDDPAQNPGLAEVCDGADRDDDCDGVANPPSQCDCSGVESRDCEDAAGAPLVGRCADGVQRCASGSWTACTVEPVSESCNDTDDDCDGSVDEAPGGGSLQVACFEDVDNDGLAASGASSLGRCPVSWRAAFGGCPPGFTDRDPALLDDCDDHAAAVRPGAPETLDGRDEDCDGAVDEGV